MHLFHLRVVSHKFTNKKKFLYNNNLCSSHLHPSFITSSVSMVQTDYIVPGYSIMFVNL